MKSRLILYLTLAAMQAMPLLAQNNAPPRKGPGEGAIEPPPIYLTEDQEAAAEAFLKEEDTTLYSRLERMKKNNPQQWRRLISNVWRRREHMLDLRDNDPDRYRQLVEERKLERKTGQLAEEYRRANSEDEKANIREQMLENLKILFDYRQANRLTEIEKLEARIVELKEASAVRARNKDAIVQKRLEELIGNPDPLTW